ncbi:riboflavin synthase [Clostridium sp. MSJ-11]|uniref:Riboflavin synthase n=1 Tax=Clostridium mobile TaxID=2841512 RepID=A0ABS6EG02_9CLOT|nr:riboflavin synthase [Clostridium mobile]MBU5483641.1 riboflavin synthase [Clostridium mobile]
MFTGIIEEIGKVKAIKKGQHSASITIQSLKVIEDVKLGDSICTNGVCLTVTAFTKEDFTVDVMPETMRKSNLKDLSIGSQVNLERALKVSDRLGGHIVSGHIDGRGRIRGFKKEDNAIWITVEAPVEILKYVIYKGSITIDGVSLTVAHVDNSEFKVSVIPHTGEETILLMKKLGDEVNLECDIIGKYVEKLMHFNDERKNYGESSINLNYLSENGFV